MITSKDILKTLIKWLPLAVTTTMLSILIYVVGQQIIRQTANLEQIQIARDSVISFEGGMSPDLVEQISQKIDISKSLQVFTIVYDDGGKPIASTALLDGKVPTIPSGIFDYVRQHGEDKVTWQPKTGVRSAIVVTRFNNTVSQTSGFVVVGKSLTEVEKNENLLLKLVAIGWACTMIATFLTYLCAKYLKHSLKLEHKR